MPIGTFLDAFPAALFISAHLAFLAIGAWALKTARDRQLPFAPALALYVASQVIFLGSFGGVLTLKMSVLIEQMLIVALVVWIVTKGVVSSRTTADAARIGTRVEGSAR